MTAQPLHFEVGTGRLKWQERPKANVKRQKAAAYCSPQIRPGDEAHVRIRRYWAPAQSVSLHSALASIVPVPITSQAKRHTGIPTPRRHENPR